MSGDDLQIALFFVAAGLGFVLTALQIMGLRHPVILVSLWAAGGLFLAVGVLWPWAKTWSLSPAPVVSALAEVGTQPLSYAVVALLLAVVLVLREKPKLPAIAEADPRPVVISEAAKQKLADSLQGKTSSPKPRYAPPKEAEQMNVEKLLYRELGGQVIALSTEISEMLMRTMRTQSSEQPVIFTRYFAPRFFWLYGEARRRGHRDSALDVYYEQPETIGNVAHLNQQLRALGERLPLYQDA